MSFKVKVGMVVYLNYSTLSFTFASIKLSFVLKIYQTQYFQGGKITLNISNLQTHFKVYQVKIGDPYEMFTLLLKANCTHEIQGFN